MSCVGPAVVLVDGIDEGDRSRRSIGRGGRGRLSSDEMAWASIRSVRAGSCRRTCRVGRLPPAGPSARCHGRGGALVPDDPSSEQRLMEGTGMAKDDASAKTLDTYGHRWHNADESARAAIGAVLEARADSVRTGG